jgi:hypothetical protein
MEKKLIPFEELWDISKININNILLKDNRYTNLLIEILENDVNLNVIISKDNDLSIIYKNEVEKYIIINTSDVIDITMLKLKDYLIEIINVILDKNKDISILANIKDNINNKYNDFINNTDNIKEIVGQYIINIYSRKLEESINMYNQIVDKEDCVDLSDKK